MKLGIVLLAFFAFPALSFSATETLSACRLKEQSRMRMNVIASNIANIKSTRTPQGGPYQRKKLDCLGATCTVSEVRGELQKYEPEHPDANEEGYVAYPKINLMDEMADMIVATREFERLIPGYPDKDDDKFRRDLTAKLLSKSRN